MRSSLLTVQATLIAVCALGAGWVNGREAVVASLYGGGLALASAWLLKTRVERAGELAKRNPKWSVYSLLFGAIQRFVIVLGGLALGMGPLALAPLPLLITFGVAQIAYLVAAGRQAMG